MPHFFIVGDNHVIVVASELVLEGSEGLSNLAFYPISLDGRTSSFEGNAQTKVAKLVGHSEYNALRELKNLTLVKKVPVFPGIVQSLLKTKISSCQNQNVICRLP